MIETIEKINGVVNHFFHWNDGFEEIRKCTCGKEYLAKDLYGLVVADGVIVLQLECSSCKKEESIKLDIETGEAEIEERIQGATSVEDLFK